MSFTRNKEIIFSVMRVSTHQADITTPNVHAFDNRDLNAGHKTDRTMDENRQTHTYRAVF